MCGDASRCFRTTHSPWVGLTHGPGWVGLDRVAWRFISFWWFGLGWVHYSKSTKMGKDYVNAFKARLDKIWMHQAVKFDVMADRTGTGNRSEGVIK